MTAGHAHDLELLGLDADMALGGWGRLFVVVTLRAPSARSMHRLSDAMAERRSALDGPLRGVFVPSAPRPGLSAESRAALREVWKDIPGQMEACAVWIRRDSFVGALLRSLVTGLVMVQPKKIITGVVTEASEAVDVLAETDADLVEPRRSQWAQALERFAIKHTEFDALDVACGGWVNRG